LCSSTMLILNKLAITAYPAPSSLLFLQLLSSSICIYVASRLRCISLQLVSISYIRSYMIVALTFLAALFSNIKVLQYANIETFIVFRASTPLAISVLDYIFLGRDLPTFKSSISLFCLLLGALSYVRADSQFEVRAYSWVFCWFAVFCFDQIFIKHVVDTADVSSWTNSFWTNTVAIVPALLLTLIRAEHKATLNADAILFVIMSCLFGVVMSVSSFQLRGMVSATYFTVIGTVCKILSVIINYFMWDKHASLPGLISLGFCVLSALFYHQSPLRSKTNECS
jgi:solute carrier family 35 protein